MTDAWTSEDMSPELLKVAERAKRDPQGRFHSLAHLIDEGALARAYHRLRKDAGVGVDGITKEWYGQDLDEHLKNLHERLRTGRYRHPGKADVRIYDYVDKQVPMLARMFERRRKGYRTIGYHEEALPPSRPQSSEVVVEYDDEALRAGDELF